MDGKQYARDCIGVVAAEVNSIEQRQIMQGIITKTQEIGKRIVIFSNLYNPYNFDESLALENYIYKLMHSPALCGIVLIAESFTNDRIREIVRAELAKRQDIPVVVIGIDIPALDFPNVTFINASDASDMGDITAHLLECHGLTKIDILTGMEGNYAAEQRIEGYKQVLEQHGVPFDPARVHYGSFWTDSGEALAKSYISGEIPLPQAVICANDYMAFGLLDTLLANGIRVPEDILVTGYEFIHERIYHAPLLTTYARGRAELGANAVEIIDALSNGRAPAPFLPPKGRMILGESCGCGPEPGQLHEELAALRTKQMYDKWNVLGTLEQQLTLCSDLDQFIAVLSERFYWVRGVHNMFLCLCENWYDTKAESVGSLLSCRSVMPWNYQHPAATCEAFDFAALYRHLSSPDTAAHYYLPLFFEKHFFGYFVLEYHTPDTYDDIFRNWMKSISIGLTFLCMKNDIRYLLQCQNLSERHDSLTGLYNIKGLEQALTARLADADAPLYAVAVRTGALVHDFDPSAQESQAALLQKTADLLRGIGTEQSICARTAPQQFVCAGIPCQSAEQCVQTAAWLRAILLHQTDLMHTQGMESLICIGVTLPAGSSSADCIKQIDRAVAEQTAQLTERRSSPHAETLFSVRNRLYETLDLSADAVCRQYSFSAGYFRQIYKDCFGVSFHQDTINARISRAVSLLTGSVMSIAGIAEQCGYEDYNYFLRQFQKVTGVTPGQYRRIRKHAE